MSLDHLNLDSRLAMLNNKLASVVNDCHLAGRIYIADKVREVKYELNTICGEMRRNGKSVVDAIDEAPHAD